MEKSEFVLNERILDFWGWVIRSTDSLANVKSGNDPIMDEFLERLHTIHPRLYFEVSGNTEPHELIISAAGRLELFSLVDSIVAEAPNIRGWKVFSLKPGKDFSFKTVYGGLEIDPQTWWFLPMLPKTGELIGLRLGIPEELVGTGAGSHGAVRTILITGLGERTFGSRINYLEVVPVPKQPEEEGYIELTDLAKYLAFRDRRAAAEREKMGG